jgi:hypothetical protein
VGIRVGFAVVIPTCEFLIMMDWDKWLPSTMTFVDCAVKLLLIHLQIALVNFILLGRAALGACLRAEVQLV